MKMEVWWNEIKCPRTDSSMYQFKYNMNVSFQIIKEIMVIRKTSSLFGENKVERLFENK